jgi:hexulose-6-phosphate isomerase
VDKTVSMIKTINAWAFAADREIGEIFRIAHEHDFEAVELTIAETGPLTLGSTEEYCRGLIELANSFAIKISSVASGLGWTYPLTSPNADTIEKGIYAVTQSLAVAKWLGTDAILVVPGGVSASFIPGFEGTSYDVAYDTALNALRRLAPVAERLGVTIAIENVWNKFLLSPLEFRDFIDEIGSPRVQTYFDVGNVLLTGHPEQWINILGKRIARVHFKDFKLSVGTLDGFCDLLDGDVDYPAVISALESVGYDGYVTAEFFNCEADLAKISRAMDTILGR